MSSVLIRLSPSPTRATAFSSSAVSSFPPLAKLAHGSHQMALPMLVLSVPLPSTICRRQFRQTPVPAYPSISTRSEVAATPHSSSSFRMVEQSFSMYWPPATMFPRLSSISSCLMEAGHPTVTAHLSRSEMLLRIQVDTCDCASPMAVARTQQPSL